jgi:putative addiction module CopG family antidote
MNVNLAPELEELLREKLQSGHYRSPDDVINAAMRLLKERDEDEAVLQRVNAGEPLPADEHFYRRLEMLLEEAEESGHPDEMTDKDWVDIRHEGHALLKSPKITLEPLDGNAPPARGRQA